MICQTVSTPHGNAIVCSGGRRKRCACGRPATLECDWKVPTHASGTCDAPICGACTTSPAPNKDICPAHRHDYEQWAAERFMEAQQS